MHTEDVFDSMVVFSKAQWLQSSTEEAEGEDGAGVEASLVPGAMPETVHRVLHQKYSFAGGASGEGGSGAAAPARGSIRDALESAGHDSDADSDAASDEGGGADGEVEVVDVDADEAEGEAGASLSGKSSRGGARSSRKAKKSYVDAGSSAEEVDSEEEEEAPLGELRRVAASTKPAPKSGSSARKAEPDASKKPAAKAAKPAAKPKPAPPSSKAPAKPKPAASSKPAPKPKPKRDRDEDSDEDSEGFVGDWQPRKVATPSSDKGRGSRERPGRTSTSSYKEESGSDDSKS